MERAFKVIHKMHQKGILKDYAIGGAVATLFYTEPFDTYDIDIFFTPPEKEKIILLTPLYDFLLKKKGYKTYKEYIMIGDTPIQFLPATTELEKEAVENAKKVKYGKDIELKILKPEYLVAIFLKVFRGKDKFKIMKLLEQAKIDKRLLQNILIRYNLKEKFEKFREKFYE
ncbi:MAG: hypothetical protein COS84_09995 [Armatimonadetes bacterium CG07_land_8_20_14_0_80_40_9]|nr:MAG: hypothetical protein COS84_09995 [Armatimonadetes bacterium CG07_land_8_20_14_0_80_40_9]